MCVCVCACVCVCVCVCDIFFIFSSLPLTRTHPHHSNMKVDMSSDSSKHTWFKVMPRYKVRAEGDHVRMVDQVVLESVKTTGQFLHSTQSVLPVSQ